MEKAAQKISSLEPCLKSLIEDLKKQAIGILIYGSYLSERERAKDVDLLVITDGGFRYYRRLKLKGFSLPIEIEYMPCQSLEFFLTRYYWWPYNWELEIGKYVHGCVLYDPKGVIRSFVRRVAKMPPHIWLYLFVHRTGRCVHHIEKMHKLVDDHIGQSLFFLDFLRDVTMLRLLVIEKYPSTAMIHNDLDHRFRTYLLNLIAHPDVDRCEELIKNLVDESREKIYNCLQANKYSIPIYYIEDIKGVMFIRNMLGYRIKMLRSPSDIVTNPLGGWKNHEYVW